MFIKKKKRRTVSVQNVQFLCSEDENLICKRGFIMNKEKSAFVRKSRVYIPMPTMSPSDIERKARTEELLRILKGVPKQYKLLWKR